MAIVTRLEFSRRDVGSPENPGGSNVVGIVGSSNFKFGGHNMPPDLNRFNESVKLWGEGGGVIAPLPLGSDGPVS